MAIPLLANLASTTIAVRDHLNFGLIRGCSLFKAVTRYPSLDRLGALTATPLVIVGDRDPLIDVGRATCSGTSLMSKPCRTRVHR